MHYDEYRKRKDAETKWLKACDAVANGLGGEMAPHERDRAKGHRPSPNKLMPNPSHHGRTPMKDHVCPAKQYAHHPDAELRALAEAQADEMHKANDIAIHGCVHKGKCWAKACRSERKGISVQYSKSAQKWRERFGRNVLGA